MEVAEDRPHRAWEGPLLGGRDLAVVFAQDRRNEGQPKRRVDLLLGLARDDLAAVDLAQRILVQRPSAEQGALPQLDVVPLRAREIEARGAELVGLHDAQIDLRPAPRDHARLRVPAHQHPLDDRHRHERGHHRRRVARRDHHVDVPHRLREAPERAAVRRVRDAQHLAEAGDDPRCQRERHRDGRAVSRALLVEPREGLGDLLLGLGAEALEPLHLVPRERGARSSIDCTPSSARSFCTALGPMPWMRNRATTVAGCLPRSSSSFSTLPVSSSSRTLAAVLLPMPWMSRSSLAVSSPRSVPWAAIDCAALS